MKNVVFLDRDGPINVDDGFVGFIDKWNLSPGALEGMKILADAGYLLTVITNQSGIAQGFYTETDMTALHDHMRQQAKQAGVTIAAVAFCPHGRESLCDCRKPKTGMAKQIEAAIGPIDYAQSWTIGDKEADIGFGQRTGTKTALMRSKYWNEQSLKTKPDLVVDSLLDAAQRITGKQIGS